MTSRLTHLLMNVAAVALMARIWMQVPGFAEIASPQQGDRLVNLTTIRGTANHPDFVSYELSFAQDPNLLDTWFPITDLVESPVQDDRLALWDTGAISPGTYQVRLTVFPAEGEPLEAIVSGLRIGPGEEPIEPLAVAPEGDDRSRGTGTDERVPIVDQPIPASQPPSPETTVVRLIGSGALAALAALTLVGAYALLRPRIRRYMGHLQMRRLHSRERRDRNPPAP
jgi:hypothetical protein